MQLKPHDDLRAQGYEHPFVHAPTREVLRHRTLSWLPRILRSRVTFVPFAWPPWNAARVVDPSNNPRSARCTSTQADGTPSDSGSVPWPTAPATTPPSPSWRSPARGVQNQGETPLAAEAQAARTRRTAAASASLVPGFPSSSLAVNPRRSRARVWRRAGVGTNATVLSRASESTAVRMACVANEVIAALGSDRHLQFRHSGNREVHTALRDRTSKRTRYLSYASWSWSNTRRTGRGRCASTCASVADAPAVLPGRGGVVGFSTGTTWAGCWGRGGLAITDRIRAVTLLGVASNCVTVSPSLGPARWGDNWDAEGTMLVLVAPPPPLLPGGVAAEAASMARLRTSTLNTDASEDGAAEGRPFLFPAR